MELRGKISLYANAKLRAKATLSKKSRRFQNTPVNPLPWKYRTVVQGARALHDAFASFKEKNMFNDAFVVLC